MGISTLLRRSAGRLVPRAGGASRDDVAFSSLHWATAALSLTAAASGTAALLSRRGTADGAGAAAAWAPVALAPVAGTAHLVRALRPGRNSRRIARLVDGTAVGAGIGGALLGAYAARPGRRPPVGRSRRAGSQWRDGASLAPLSLGAVGLLGLALDREERRDAGEHARLARRARVVDRLVPRRRPRIDRLVVRV